MRKAFLWILVLLLLAPTTGRAVGELGTSDDAERAYREFRDDQYRRAMDEEEALQIEFKTKAQQLDMLFKTETPIYFKADTQEYRQQENLYVLEGNVRLRKDRFVLKADRVTIHELTSEMIATGDVEITFRRDVITCTRAEILLEEVTGKLYDCRGALEPSVYFECAVLEKLPDHPDTEREQYVMTDGTVTSCTGDEVPDWSIRSRRALARIENYMYLRHPTLKVKKLSLLYSPFWIYPIKTGRVTGFLLPRIGWSSRRGFQFRDEFFWAITDHWDATFGVEVFSNVGWSQTLESRWVLGVDSRGELDAEHWDETNPPVEDTVEEERYRLLLNDTHVYRWDIRQVLRLDYYSDQYYDRDYGTELEALANRALTSSAAWTKRWSRATATLDAVYLKDLDENQRRALQRLPRLSVNTGSQRIGRTRLRWSVSGALENLYNEGQETYTRDLLDEFGNPVGSLQVEDWIRAHVTRGDVQPGLRWLLSPFSWLNVEPWAEYQVTYWSEGKSVNPDFEVPTWATLPEEPEEPSGGTVAGLDRQGEGYLRRLYSVGCDLTGPKAYRIFERGESEELRFPKIKHLIYPEVRFQLTPEVNQDPLLELDSLDRIDERRSITYSLVNTILAKEVIAPARWRDQHSLDPDALDPDEAAQDLFSAMMRGVAGQDEEESEEESAAEIRGRDRVREWARFTISHTYDFAKEGRWLERYEEWAAGDSAVEPGRNDLPSGDVHLQAIANPTFELRLRNDLYINPYERELVRMEWDADIKQPRWNLKLGWMWNRNDLDEELDDLHVVDMQGGVVLTKLWEVEGGLYYDLERSRWYRGVLDLTYNSQCWSLTLNSRYRQDLLSGSYPDWTLEDEFQFGFTLSLRNIGEVGFVDLDDFAY